MKSAPESPASFSSAFSARAEWRLILACARVQLDPVQRHRIRELLKGRVDWTDVVITATQHRVESLVHRHLLSEFAGAVPASALQSFKEISRERSSKNLHLTGQLVALLDLFEKEEICAIPYKGPTLAALAYGNFGLRYCEDLDFALPQREVTRALQVLVTAGFRTDLNPSEARDARLLAQGQVGQYCFYSDAQRILVELHTENTLRYFPIPIDWEMLCQKLEPVTIGGRQFSTFPVEALLLLLSVHGAKHFWNRLSWVCDIAAITQTSRELDWELSLQLARRLGCGRMWLLGLALANSILDAPLPAHVLHKIRGDSGLAPLVRNVQARMLRRDRLDPNALGRFSFRLRSHEAWTQGLRQCLRVATRPTEDDLRAFALPEWAASLYPLLRPFRLLRQHGLGLRPRS